ncbi:MAG: TIGR01244 family sulfur transferase [Cellvibrionaceae bacterium]
MERKVINDSLSVSGQISIADIAQLQDEGVKTIICNRPDHEDPGQLEVDQVKAAAESAGLAFYFMPVVSGQVGQAQGEQFSRILSEAPKPIHAYCRSGTRCTILWAITELLAGQDKNTVVQTAANAGYDLSKTFV